MTPKEASDYLQAMQDTNALCAFFDEGHQRIAVAFGVDAGVTPESFVKINRIYDGRVSLVNRNDRRITQSTFILYGKDEEFKAISAAMFGGI